MEKSTVICLIIIGLTTSPEFSATSAVFNVTDTATPSEFLVQAIPPRVVQMVQPFTPFLPVRREQIEELPAWAHGAVRTILNSQHDAETAFLASTELYQVCEAVIRTALAWIKIAPRDPSINIADSEYRRLVNGMTVLGYGGIGRQMFYGLSSDIDLICLFPPTVVDGKRLEQIKDALFDIVKRAIPNNQKRDIHPLSQLADMEEHVRDGTYSPMDAVILAHPGFVAGDEHLYAHYLQNLRSAFETNLSYNDVHLMTYFIRRIFRTAFPDDSVDLKYMEGGFSDISFLYQYAAAANNFHDMRYLEALAYLQNHQLITKADVQTVTDMLGLLTRIRLAHNEVRISRWDWGNAVRDLGLSPMEFESKRKSFSSVVRKVEMAVLQTTLEISPAQVADLTGRRWDSPSAFRTAHRYFRPNRRLDNFIFWRTADEKVIRTLYSDLTARHSDWQFHGTDWLDLLALCGNENTPSDILDDVADHLGNPLLREHIALIGKNSNTRTSTLLHIATTPMMKTAYHAQGVDTLYEKLLHIADEPQTVPPLVKYPGGMTNPEASLQLLGKRFETLPEESAKTVIRQRIFGNLKSLYGTTAATLAFQEIVDLQRGRVLSDDATPLSARYDQGDALLTTFPDSITEDGASSLRALSDFTRNHLTQIFNRVHLLPFFTWDIDRGFSVVDYRQVDPRFGNWEDVEDLRTHRQLAFDLVANHASIDHPWVQSALICKALSRSDPRRERFHAYENFVMAYRDDEAPSDQQMAQVIHIRTSGLLSRFYVITEKEELRATFDPPRDPSSLIFKGMVWTTFKRPEIVDGRVRTRQVDFNYANPHVIVEMCRLLGFYIDHGASLFRLDSAPILWKEPGRFSLHEPETLRLLQIIRDTVLLMDPSVLCLAEVKDEPAREISYLGRPHETGIDLIYQFSYYPMALYTILKSDVRYFLEWIPRLAGASGRQLLLLAGSHDGMTVRPLEGPLDGSAPLLPAHERRWLADTLLNHHDSFANYRLIDGKEVLREIVTTPWDAVNPSDRSESLSLQVDRYIASLALGLGLRGIPTLYANGLFVQAMQREGLVDSRDANRVRISMETLQRQLTDPTHRMYHVFQRVKHLLNLRAAEKSMDPSGPPEIVLDVHNDHVAGVLLRSRDLKESVISLVNVSSEKQTIHLSEMPQQIEGFRDLIESHFWSFVDGVLRLTLRPYHVLWLKATTVELSREAQRAA